MDKEKLEYFKNKLIEKKAQNLEIINNLSNSMRGISKCEVKEDMDYASVSSESDRNLKLINNLKLENQEIDEALEKIEDGSYGICDMCEEDINIERLEIKPHAKYCIECREEIEKESKGK